MDPIEVGLRDVRSRNPRARVHAVDLLGQLGPEAHPRRAEAIEALRQALSDPEPLVRYNAVLSLSELRPAGLRATLEALMQDEDPLARQAAAMALGELGDGEAIPALEEALREGGPELRFQVIVSLWELKRAGAVPLLRRALSDEDGEVRARAASCLADYLQDVPGAQRGPEARALADELAPLLSDKHPAARTEGAMALSWLGDRRALPALLALLTHQEHDLAAIAALERLGGEDALPSLQKISRGFFQPVGRRLAAAAAILQREPSAAPERALLEKHARATRSLQRPFALACLGRVGAEWALELLLAELRGARGGWHELGEALVQAHAKASPGRASAIEAALREAREKKAGDEEARADLSEALDRIARGAPGPR